MNGIIICSEYISPQEFTKALLQVILSYYCFQFPNSFVLILNA